MESNTDRAIRLRDMAERKLKEGDLVGAKRFIQEARQLYPYLGGAIQLSAILDVHIAAQVKVGRINEPDYYGILLVHSETLNTWLVSFIFVLLSSRRVLR